MINHFAVAFIALVVFINGILYKNVDTFYALIVLIGAWVFYAKRLSLPVELKTFYRFALFLILAITIAVVEYSWQAFFGWRFSSFQLLIFIPFIASFFIHFIRTEEVFWRVLIVSALSGLLWTCLILINWPVPRSTGLLSDAINRGNMGMLFGIISLVAFFAVDQKRWKVLAFFAFLGGVSLSILSASRGGWLSLILVLITITFIFFRFKQNREFFSLFIIQMVLILGLWLFWSHLPLEGRVEQVVDDINRYFSGNIHSSVGYRFELWKASVYAFLEHPLLGWGWTNFNSAHEMMMQKGYVESTRLFGHPHNQFFLFLVESGLLGTIALIGFVLWPGIYATRYLRRLNGFDSSVYLALLMIVVTETLVEFMLTDDSFSQKYFIFVFVFVSICVLNFLHYRSENEQTTK